MNTSILKKAMLKINTAYEKSSFMTESVIKISGERKKTIIELIQIEQNITIIVDCEFNNDSILIDFKTLLNIVKKIKSNDLNLIVKDNVLTILYDKFNQKVKGCDCELLKAIEVESIDNKLDSAFIDGLNSVIYAAAHNDVRYYLNSVFVDLDKNQIVASSGHVLAMTKNFDNFDLNQNLIIPIKNAIHIATIFKNVTDLNIIFDHDTIQINSKEIVYKFKKLDARYPDFQQVFDIEKHYIDDFEYVEFKEIVEALCVQAVDKSCLLFEKQDDKCNILLKGKSDITLLCQSYSDIKISIDCKYLNNLIKQVKNKVFSLSLTDNYLLIEYENQSHLIMSMRY